MEEFLGEIRSWCEATTLYVNSHPEELFMALLATLAMLLFVSLVAVRGARRSRESIESLTREVQALRAEVSALLSAAQREVTAPVVVERPVIAERAPIEELPAPVTAEPVAPPPAPPVEIVPEESVVSRGLRKSRLGLLGKLASFFSGKPAVDSSMLDELEEILILSDIGAKRSEALVGDVRRRAQEQGGVAPSELKGLLKEGILSTLRSLPEDHRMYRPSDSPMVVLVVGVNGVGKTTTVAKLAAKYKDQGKKVLVIAADTFRAAAVEQLAEWSRRVGFTLSRGAEGAKPGAVVFDGMVAAKEGAYDVVLIDTAGRLHNKSNLMQELEGVRNSIRKHILEAPHETVLVLDGVSGQNALMQAREFNTAVSLTGLVVTKLDGTPKGGIIVAISEELQVPVLYIGVGEKVGDLVRFDKREFVEALFESSPGDARGESVSARAIND